MGQRSTRDPYPGPPRRAGLTVARLRPLPGFVVCRCPIGAEHTCDEWAVCSVCEQDDEARYPIDSRYLVCWACIPCVCGQGCGFDGADTGRHTCEWDMTDAEIDAKLEAGR